MIEAAHTVTRFLFEAFNVAYVLLFLLLWLAWYLIRRAERVDGYWSTLFMDDAGKKSALRVATLVALAVHSAVILYLVTSVVSLQQVKVQDALASLEFHIGLYAAVWSGAAVVSKALDVLIARFAPK